VSVVLILPPDLFYFVNYFCSFGKGKKLSKGLLFIWNAVNGRCGGKEIKESSMVKLVIPLNFWMKL
jgi:hypothetical protein